MKHIYTLFIFLGLSMQQSIAQTYVFNWNATNVLVDFLTGLLTGNVNNVNNSLVNAGVTITSTQGNVAFTSFGDFTSPSVTNSPFTTQLGSVVPNMAVGCNFNSRTQYTDIVINFNNLVHNVRFNIADIDKRLLFTDYFDQVTVTGRNNGALVTNPTLTKLVANSDYVVISGNTAHANTTWWEGGNSASSVLDQRATVVVDFANTTLDEVVIRYGNHPSVKSNPEDQAIAIGNISFERVVVLPRTLNAFNGNLVNNNSIKLNWSTAQEVDVAEYVVEKSSDARNWQTVTTVKAAGNSSTNKDYTAIDPVAAATNYYRLKQVDISGNYTYSSVLRINATTDKNSIRLYPNPVINNATLNVNSIAKLQAQVKLYNKAGTLLQQWQRPLIAGSNNIPVPGVQALPAGAYVVIVEDEQFNRLGSASFIKQ